MVFDPFGKQIAAIVSEDLEKLREVSEGWYVEYKRGPIPARKIAKSIAAFANHFGGWLIFGVDAPDHSPVAFPGLISAEVDAVLQGIRDAIRDHVNPPPDFQHRVVYGKDNSLGLASDSAVVLIQVPQGQNPPYVHSSGVIYRRLADSSEPKPESDRGVIDLLVDRAEKYRESFRKRIEKRPILSDAEKDIPILQMFLTTDPWTERSISKLLSHESFARIVGSSDAGFSIPLECAFPRAFGFCGRQVGENDPFNLSLTWNVSFRGFSEALFPLRTLDSSHTQHYKFATSFLNQLPNSLRSRAIDATLLWLFVANALRVHAALASEIGIQGKIHVKLKFINMWRRVPYVDSQAFMNFIQKNGLPVVQEAECYAPPGSDPDDMHEVDCSRDDGMDDASHFLLRAADVLYWALNAIGLPSTALVDPGAMDELSAMFNRAVKANGPRARS